MKVTPISEADARAAGLWKRGLYDFQVMTAIDTQSKAGNEMIELETKVFNQEGRFRIFKDWLVSSDHPLNMAKVRHFASATGLLPQYEKGELRAADCIDKTGQCQIGIEKGKDPYPDKNKIADYAPTPAKGAPLIASVTELPDDEIPF